MKRRLILLTYLLPESTAQGCKVRPCRSCVTAGRTAPHARSLWHVTRRRQWLTYALSVLATLAVFAGLARLARAGGLTTAEYALIAAVAGMVLLAGTVLTAVVTVPERHRPRTAPAAPVRLDPNTNLDDLPDDYGDGHGPVPTCCDDCDAELLLRAEAAPYREASR